MELKIPIETNPITVDFLNAILDLGFDTYRHFYKPDMRLHYISTASCHPTIVFKNLVKGARKKILNLSSNQNTFDAAAPSYN